MTTIKKYKIVLGTLTTYQTVIVVRKFIEKLKMTNHESRILQNIQTYFI